MAALSSCLVIHRQKLKQFSEPHIGFGLTDENIYIHKIETMLYKVVTLRTTERSE